MDKLDIFRQVVSALTEAQQVVIVLPSQPSFDLLAAGTALYLAFQKSKNRCSLICPTLPTVAVSSLFGINKARQRIGGQNLTISLDYDSNSVDKISYNIDNNKFNLVVEPKPGFSPLSSEKATFSYSGKLDTVLILGLSDLQGLEDKEDRQRVTEAKIISLNLDDSRANFGKINLYSPELSSYSEMAIKLLAEGQLPLDQDIATNLFSGLRTATGNFTSPKVSASTFEAAAFCLRSGGQLSPPSPAGVVSPSASGPASSPSVPPPQVFKGSTRV